MHDGPLAARGRYRERRRTAAALPHRHQPRPPRCVALSAGREPGAPLAGRAPLLRLASLAERDAPLLQVERVAVPDAEKCVPVHDFSSCLTADARRACGLATPIVLPLLEDWKATSPKGAKRAAADQRPDRLGEELHTTADLHGGIRNGVCVAWSSTAM